jgi:hypothetical protein
LLDNGYSVVKAEDFTEIGGVRKAYTTVKAAGIREPIRAYLNAHVFYVESYEDREVAPVVNKNRNNAHYVTLLPHNDPTIVEQIVKGGTAHNVSFTVRDADGGVRISDLREGAHLRIFTVNGVQVYNRKNSEAEVFVPLKSGTIYLISDGSEILKYIKQ